MIEGVAFISGYVLPRPLLVFIFDACFIYLITEILMGMYSQFKTDKNLEQKGITIDYGDFRVTIARAGSANNKFVRVHELLTKPVRRLIDQDILPREKELQINRELYAKAVILNWEVKDGQDKDGGDKWKQGIEAQDGTVLPFNEENVIATFANLPDLFADITIQATNMKLFLASNREADAKN
jgi:hypothetical protein